MASGPITSWQMDGETMEIVTHFIFLAPKSLQMVAKAMKLKDTCSLEAMKLKDTCSYDQPRQHIKKQRHKRTKWRRSRWRWSTSVSMDTSGIHLQTQKGMQNTS